MRKAWFFFLTAGIFSAPGSFAQTVTPTALNTTGGTNFFTFYRFEWSFGEAMAIETMSASNIIVTNGVLQPGTHNPAIINNTGAWDSDEIKILPNPTQNILEIDFFSKQSGKVTMNLYDNSGRFMGSKQFVYSGTGRIERWDLGRYPYGMYFLNIQLVPAGNSVAKKGSYKIQKIK